MTLILCMAEIFRHNLHWKYRLRIGTAWVSPWSTKNYSLFNILYGGYLSPFYHHSSRYELSFTIHLTMFVRFTDISYSTRTLNKNLIICTTIKIIIKLTICKSCRSIHILWKLVIFSLFFAPPVTFLALNLSCLFSL